MDGLEREQGRPRDGFSLVGVLMIVAVLGILTASAAIGVSSMTDSNDVGKTTGTPPATRGARDGIGAVIGTSKAVACRASADGAQSASTLYFAQHGGSYPVRWSDLTTSKAPIYRLAAGVTINRANPKELDGRDWKLILAGGGSVAATFTCT